MEWPNLTGCGSYEETWRESSYDHRMPVCVARALNLKPYRPPELPSPSGSDVVNHVHHLSGISSHAKDRSAPSPSLPTESSQHLPAESNQQSPNDFTRPFQCPYCSSRFSQLIFLEIHEKDHRMDTSETCLACLSKRVETLDKRRLRCRHCEFAFNDSCDLRMHELTHGVSEKPHQCSFCGAAFKKRAHLTRHERKHTGEKPFQCRVCQRRFSDNSNLLKHYRSKHVGEKSFTCQYCGMGFSRRKYLQKHEETHTIFASDGRQETKSRQSPLPELMISSDDDGGAVAGGVVRF